MHAVVIGTSAAGIAALETLRRLGGSGVRLTAVSEEPAEPYSRCLLPDLLAGKKNEYSIRFRPAGFWQKMGVEFIGQRAVALRAEEKKFSLRTAASFPLTACWWPPGPAPPCRKYRGSI